MNIIWTSQFKKDYKRVKKQGKDLDDLRSVIEMLVGRSGTGTTTFSAAGQAP